MPQPVVCLAEIVEDDPASVAAVSGQDDGRARVRLAGHPRAVERVHDEERRHDEQHARRNLPEGRKGFI